MFLLFQKTPLVRVRTETVHIPFQLNDHVEVKMHSISVIIFWLLFLLHGNKHLLRIPVLQLQKKTCTKAPNIMARYPVMSTINVTLILSTHGAIFNKFKNTKQLTQNISALSKILILPTASRMQ